MSRTLQSIVLAAVFGLGVLVGSSALSTGTAQQAPQAAWRYQLCPAGNHGVLFFLDTATGRAWVNKVGTRDDWEDFKTPVFPEAKK